jgi:hypothetical protein
MIRVHLLVEYCVFDQWQCTLWITYKTEYILWFDFWMLYFNTATWGLRDRVWTKRSLSRINSKLTFKRDFPLSQDRVWRLSYVGVINLSTLNSAIRILDYLLTCNKALLHKLMTAQLVEKFPVSWDPKTYKRDDKYLPLSLMLSQQNPAYHSHIISWDLY